MKIKNNLVDIKIIIIPSCPIYDLWVQIDTQIKPSLWFYGGAYSSSELDAPLEIGGLGCGSHYDCWDFNFKKDSRLC